MTEFEQKVKNLKKSLDDDDNIYVRNFNLILSAVLKYEDLFTEEEKAKIKLFLS